MKKTTLSASVAVALALAASGSAMAQSTTIKLGVVNINPNSDATAISGPLTPANTLSLDVQSATTLFFSAAQDIDDNWQGELALGVPPKHDVNLVVLNPAAVPGSVAALNGAVVATVKQVAPTLFVNYRFFDKTSTFRPFVGVGVNYTYFASPESTATGNTVNGGPTNISLKSSWGLAAQLGVTAKINDAWSLTGAWSTAQVKTTMTSNTLGIQRTADIKFSPSVFILAAGYSF
jgi:outer membrane protein